VQLTRPRRQRSRQGSWRRSRAHLLVTVGARGLALAEPTSSTADADKTSRDELFPKPGLDASLPQMGENRTTEQRIADTLALFAENPAGWLATADAGTGAHVIAVSACWTGDALLIATRGDSPTARNLAATGSATLALGTPDDAVLVDLALTERRASGGAAGELGSTFMRAMGWDPAHEPGSWDYFLLTPRRIQAYRGYSDRRGSTIMREGRWLA